MLDKIETMDAATLAPVLAAGLRRWNDLGRDLAREIAALGDVEDNYDEALSWLQDIVDGVPLD